MRLAAAGVPIQYVAKPFLLHHAGASSGGERSAAAEALYYSSYAVLLRKHFAARQMIPMLARTFLKERNRPRFRSGRWREIGLALARGLVRRRRAIPRV